MELKLAQEYGCIWRLSTDQLWEDLESVEKVLTKERERVLREKTINVELVDLMTKLATKIMKELKKR